MLNALLEALKYIESSLPSFAIALSLGSKLKMRFSSQSLLLGSLISIAPSPTSATISATDQLAILTQMNLHQSYIDNDASLAAAKLWLSLYWPEATFTNTDGFGTVSRNGSGPTNNEGLKFFYDLDHSLFPLNQWYHTVGTWRFIDLGDDTRAGVHWRWRVDWKTNATGVVSTGTYDDVFEKRGEDWKVLNRTSIADPNWPTWLFQPYLDLFPLRFKQS